jgi:histidinol-phosphate aminotransferase
MSETIVDRLRVARELYDAVPLYDPKRTPVAIDLTDNTNLWGMPPRAEATLRAIPLARITRYPSLYAAELKAALADYVGTTPDQIVTGCGSDDVLDSALRAFADPGELVAATDPTFAMVPIFARMNALESVLISERADHTADLQALAATGARCIYVCSPNNPTGVTVPRTDLEWLLANSRATVIVDEAYIEFGGESAVPLTASHDRLLVVRTMSKAFGLAGLRIGYAIGAPALVAAVEKSRGPYKVNALAEQVALAALRNDLPWVREHIALAIANRDRLTLALREMGLAPVPSSANFVCVPVANAVAVGLAMRAHGVGVRPFPALPKLGDTLRISAGPWELMEECLRVLRLAMSEVRA